MRTSLIYTLLCTLCLYGITAQTPQTEKEKTDHVKLKTLQIEHLSKLLELSDKKKETLSLLLDKHHKKVKALHEAFKPNRKKLKDIKTLSDEEAKSIFEEIKKFEQQKFAFRNEMLDQLDGVLSPQQKLQFIKAKMHFRSELLKRSYEKRHRHDSRPPHQHSE